MFEDAGGAQAKRKAGAATYLTKSGPLEELNNAIRTGACNSGNNIFSSQMMFRS